MDKCEILRKLDEVKKYREWARGRSFRSPDGQFGSMEYNSELSTFNFQSSNQNPEHNDMRFGELEDWMFMDSLGNEFSITISLSWREIKDAIDK